MARLLGAFIIIACLFAQLLKAQECAEGGIRLVLDTAMSSNKEVSRNFPEYCLEGLWRRACTGDGRWRINHTDLACKQLGFAGRIADGGACSDNPPGASSGSGNFFRITNKQCEPVIQENLSECGLEPLAECNCTSTSLTRNHGWVVCQSNCTNGEVRLADGTNSTGRVEVCGNGRWTTVCNNRQPQDIANSACTQLGLGEAVVIEANPGYLPIGNCSVAADGAITCNIITDISCDHSMDLGVQCEVESTTQESTTESTTQESTTQESTTQESTTQESTMESTTQESTTQESTIVDTTMDSLNSTNSDQEAVAGLGTVTAILAIGEVVIIVAIAMVCKALKKRSSLSGSKKAEEIHYYSSADTPVVSQEFSTVETNQNKDEGAKYIPIIDGPSVIESSMMGGLVPEN